MSSSPAHSPAALAPHVVAEALIGSAHVELEYGHESARLPFWVPPVNPYEPDGVEVDVRPAQRRMALLLGLLAVVVASLLLAGGFWLGRASSASGGAVKLVQWDVSSMSGNVLVLQVGTQSVPVGLNERLPNGEVLVAVDSQKSSYLTNRRAVTLFRDTNE